MNLQRILLEIAITELKKKNVLSDLEKDIFSAISICISAEFDRNEAERKIVEISMKYPNVGIATEALLGMEISINRGLKDESVWNVLVAQTLMLTSMR